MPHVPVKANSEPTAAPGLQGGSRSRLGEQQSKARRIERGARGYAPGIKARTKKGAGSPCLPAGNGRTRRVPPRPWVRPTLKEIKPKADARLLAAVQRTAKRFNTPWGRAMTRLSPAAAAQKALYEQVAAAIAPFPHVALGTTGMRPFDDKTGEGCGVEIGFPVWTAGGGRLQAFEISKTISTALHRRTIAVEGCSVMSCELTEQQAAGGPSGACRVANGFRVYIHSKRGTKDA